MLLVACGLLSEARIARGKDGNAIRVIAGGGDAAWLRAELTAAAPRCRGVLSFGVAGGLKPELQPGDVHVAKTVIAPDGDRFESDSAWTRRLVARLGCSAPATFACVERPLTDLRAKADLHDASGAMLVDMESSIAADVAVRHRLPFAALRVVTDTAEAALPPAVAVSMKRGGALDVPAILGSILRKPDQIPALIRTGRDSRPAFAALLRCRELLGPGFALVDLG